MSPSRFVVIGDVMIDVVVRPLDVVAPTSDTSSSVRIGRGGSGANLAVAIASFGHEVHYVGAVGDDLPGQMFKDALIDSGVVPRLEVVDGPTGVVVAVVAPDAQRAMLTDRGVNSRLSLDHVVASISPDTDHLHVSGYTFLDTATRSLGTAVLEEMSARDVATSVDVCSLAPLMAITPTAFLEATKRSTMLFANEEEALALSGEEDATGALVWLSRCYAEVVVTRGSSGAIAARGSQTANASSSSVQVLDTTGAGDAATGAYLASRGSGETIAVALDAAMFAAARVVRGLGSEG